MSRKSYKWAAIGDVNAFFGLMLDNIADLLLTVGLLSIYFEFPTQFALQYMVPGTAIGVFVGDLIFFKLALGLAHRSGRNNITAMPLGLDTPSTFGMVFFVLGPAFSEAREHMSVENAAIFTWHIGICSIFISGVFKIACTFGSDWIRRVIPRAGLLGSLAAIALVLISFLPLIEILHLPVVGLVALAIILATLVARVPFPFRLPGALAALIVAGSIYYLMSFLGLLGHEPTSLIDPREGLLPTGWISVFSFQWIERMPDAAKYLPVVIPFALATVVGGIDCTESAAAAGDEYNTAKVIGTEAVATVIASLCGGVIQTTPYIGHPAYKAMGGRAAYVLATALFVGAAGVVGFFGYLYLLIPKATVFPILIFVGLEITAQSFLATPKKHYVAVAIACIPALAALAMMYVDNVLGDLSAITYTDPESGNIVRITESSLSPERQGELRVVRMLANGFIVTSLLWASALVSIVDRRLNLAAVYFAVMALCTFFGLIHSPLPGSPIFVPWNIDEHLASATYRFACGYLFVCLLFVLWNIWLRSRLCQFESEETTDS